ncbi:class I SAM-dependent methyltransferase [Chloroflexota bacterium]
MSLRTYFNDRADIWDENVAEKDIGKLERMAERLELKPGSKVLDVGTGTGIFLPFILNSIGENGQVVALDIAEEMLKKAQAKGFGHNIEYLNADVIDIPLESGIFDCVICYSSFPHFRDKLKALTEINRVMKSGGRLLVCHTSSRAHINEIHTQLPDVKDDLLPDSDKMRSVLSAAGFGKIKIEDKSDNYLASAVKSEIR